MEVCHFQPHKLMICPPSTRGRKNILEQIHWLYMGLLVTKPVFGGLRTTKVQTSLRIGADWSAPLLFAYWKVSYLNLLQANFNILASLWRWREWFESRFNVNPEDRFCCDKAHMISQEPVPVDGFNFFFASSFYRHLLTLQKVWTQIRTDIWTQIKTHIMSALSRI